jgi:hypothetical protein
MELPEQEWRFLRAWPQHVRVMPVVS